MLTIILRGNFHVNTVAALVSSIIKPSFLCYNSGKYAGGVKTPEV
jgi:hypothetical protein